MSGRVYRTVYEIADGQLGYVTTAQARAIGLGHAAIANLHHTGAVDRISQGVYRLARYPRSAVDEYMEASLWPSARGTEIRGVISYASALALWEMSDVSPAKIHLTVSPTYRLRRTPPPVLVLHRAALREADITWQHGIPVTTPMRTIRDCHAAHLGPALVRQAIDDGRRLGRLTLDEADVLMAELFGAKHDHRRTGSR
ncbi:MAG TPA: type IV toxin-antitoxin system AbiEi family antitoxin domain-containing protein [Gemmatimonadaceae bacterium]|jgi:predicted transcriptional regulator of viral defense system|nr:type IV toxin-antitoxin system AbiEi family antitoxin domain-containing protein [Gemmatimonadaceae bacterium]